MPPRVGNLLPVFGVVFSACHIFVIKCHLPTISEMLQGFLGPSLHLVSFL